MIISFVLFAFVFVAIAPFTQILVRLHLNMKKDFFCLKN